MLDLIWKDFVAARRFLLLVIPLGGVQLAVLASTPPIYPIAALMFAALLGFGSIALEESQRTELLWNSLPVTRDDLVTARYLVALIGVTTGLVMGWALAQLVGGRVSLGTFGPAFTSFPAHALMFGVLVLAAAVFLPLHFRFGPGRAVIFFSAVALSAVVLVSLLAQAILSAKGYPSPIFDPEAWRLRGPEMVRALIEWTAPRLGRLLGLFVALSIVALGFSWRVSRRVYETRDL
ncbi:MAG: ABC-2 transporter permease [Gemmatimonadales bacterium]|jgi:ABC-type transport system involved in multi-copper enzyme maturation permease subunit